MRPQCYPFCKLRVTPSSSFHLSLFALVFPTKSQAGDQAYPSISWVWYQLPNCNWESLWYPVEPTTSPLPCIPIPKIGIPWSP